MAINGLPQKSPFRLKNTEHIIKGFCFCLGELTKQSMSWIMVSEDYLIDVA
jgi:hypothetical protein